MNTDIRELTVDADDGFGRGKPDFEVGCPTGASQIHTKSGMWSVDGWPARNALEIGRSISRKIERRPSLGHVNSRPVGPRYYVCATTQRKSGEFAVSQDIRLDFEWWHDQLKKRCFRSCEVSTMNNPLGGREGDTFVTAFTARRILN